MSQSTDTQPPTEKRKAWLLAPVLVGIFPVLSLYIGSLPDARLRDAAVYGGVVVALAVALAYLLRFFYAGATRASLAAFAVIAWLFLFSSYRRLGQMTIELVSKSAWNDYVLMSVWIALLLATLVLLYRVKWSDARLTRLYRFAELACLISIGFTLVQGGKAFFLAHHAPAAPAQIWARNSEVMPAGWKPAAPAQKRDIYFLVFDRYANEDTLHDYFGFDNSSFYDELEKRGFVANRHAKTSYPMTGTSMASTLNMRYLNSHFDKIADYFEPLEMNKAAKLFIEAGYRYCYFGNQYDPMRKSRLAQWSLRVSMLPCEFADALVTMTPLRPLIGRQHKRQFVLEKFAGVAKLASDPALTYAYAHFLVPHPPYAFERDGSGTTEFIRNTRPEKELYINQLIATNREIFKMIDAILSKSSVKPIIVLQSDEGPYLMEGDESLSSAQKIAKRSGILNAFYLPDDEIRDRLPPAMLPVNTFRFLFKEYFGAPISLLPDRLFYWKTPEPSGIARPNSDMIELTGDRSTAMR